MGTRLISQIREVVVGPEGHEEAEREGPYRVYFFGDNSQYGTFLIIT